MAYLSDIEIAQQCRMRPITEIAALAGVETERYMLDRYVEQRLWNEARFGRDVPKEDLKEAQSQAVQMAAQAIRLAAMICKLERSQRRWKRKAGKSA